MLGAIDNAKFFKILKERTDAPFKPESKSIGEGRKLREVIKKDVSTPLGDMSKFFAGIDKSLVNLLKFAADTFKLDMLEARDKSRKKLKAGDTDKPTKGKGKSMLDSLKESFEGMKGAFANVSIGDKLGAALLIGGLLLFNQVQDALVAVLTPIIKVVKGMINIFGPKGTFMIFLGAFLAIKFRGLIASALKVAKVLGPGIWKGIGFAFNGINKASGLLLKGAKNSLSFLGKVGKELGGLTKNIGSTVFKSLNYVGGQLVTVAKGTVKGLSGGMMKSMKLLGTAFKAMRVFMMGTMLPAVSGMIASMIPMAVAAAPFILIGAAIVAGLVAVFVSLKSAFGAFQKSREEGDSMLTAIGKAVLDFTATLVTLPITLVKNLIGYVAGLLGFDGIKEKLEEFSFKDAFINIILSFVGKVKDFFTGLMNFDIAKLGEKIQGLGSTIANIMKALGKGALAFVKAIPKMLFGGEHPTAAFSRVYNEVRSSGSAQEKADKVSSSSSETNVTSSTEKFNTETKSMAEKQKLLTEKTNEKTMLEKGKGGSPILINNNKSGDVYNQKSETNVSGELSTDHSDRTARALDDAMMAGA